MSGRRGSAMPGGQRGGGSDSGQELGRSYREAIRELTQVQQSLGDNPEMAKEIGDALREMRRSGNDPGSAAELDEKIRRQILPAIEGLELRLRRELDDRGQIRNSAADPIPQGYSGAVAEYFRKLSKSK